MGTRPVKKPEIVAICTADWHLWHKAPSARAEEHWPTVQAAYLGQVRDLLVEHRCPLINAGDVFDRPDPPVWFANWAIRHVPRMYAVPGQHDLPGHRLQDVGRSAYGTLKMVGNVWGLEPGEPVEVPGPTPLRLHGFPWGFAPRPLKAPHDLLLEVAVVHKYVWKGRCGYPGAPEASRIKNLWEQFAGYDVVVIGDNHTPWEAVAMHDEVRHTVAFNVGTFIRRKADEKKHRPSVGLLHADGTVGRHYLDVSADRWADNTVTIAAAPSGVAEELSRLADVAVDFGERLRRAAESQEPAVKAAVLGALAEGQG